MAQQYTHADLVRCKIQSALLGSTVTSLFMTPLDVAKTRMQTTLPQTTSRAATTMGTLRTIFATEGFCGLWRGLTPTVVGSVPNACVYYVGYEYIRDYLSATVLPPVESSKYNVATATVNAHSETVRYHPLSPLIAGSLARTATATLLSPVELVRTRLQSGLLGSSVSEVCSDLAAIVGTHGVSSLWRGLAPTLLRDVPFSALYWTSYEYLRASQGLNSIAKWVHSSHMRSESASTSKAEAAGGSGNQGYFVQSFLAGASAGGIAAVVTTPFDVIKTLQQVNSPSDNLVDVANSSKSKIEQRKTRSPTMYEMAQKIMKEEGTKGFMRGLGPRLMKVAPACAIFISSYEIGKHIFLPKIPTIKETQIAQSAVDNANIIDQTCPEDWNSVPNGE